MPAASQREKLYLNALMLFYNKGFKATTMRDIASSMNFEAASLYNYIDSKDALLEEMLFDVADQFLDGIKHIQASKLSRLDQIRDIIGLYIQVTARNPFKAALLTSEWRNLKQPILKRFLDHRGEFENYLSDIIEMYFDEIGMTKIDTTVAMHTFLGSTRWICDWYIQHKGEIDPDVLQDQLTHIILNGLAQPK